MRKKTTILIILLITGLTSFGQSCEIINNRKVNCVDTKGLKQGVWEVWNYNWEQEKNYVSIPGFCQTPPLIKVPKYLIAKGKYLDSKKIGQWNFYDQNDSTNVERTITFFDKGLAEERNFVSNYLIKVNTDSSTIIGQIYYDNDTININCSNQLCSFKLNENTDLLTFGFKKYFDLKFELERVAMGVYRGKFLYAQEQKNKKVEKRKLTTPKR